MSGLGESWVAGPMSIANNWQYKVNFHQDFVARMHSSFFLGQGPFPNHSDKTQLSYQEEESGYFPQR